MTVRDFAAKEWRLYRERGFTPALGEAIREGSLKTFGHVLPFISTPVWAAEWDICLVLDGCRVDTLGHVAEDYDWLPDEIPWRWSVGSASPEWISATFAPAYDEKLTRTAYVSANPFTGTQPTSAEHVDDSVVPLVQRPLAYLDEPWRDQWEPDAECPTVAADVVTERAAWLWQRRDRYDAERLVAHYMQPHAPFRSRPEWSAGWRGVSKYGDEAVTTGGKDIWSKVRDGDLNRIDVRDAYRDNLRWALDEVALWRRCTDATILITADHGNSLGEWGVWGHPAGAAAPQVRRVPWVTIDGVGEEDFGRLSPPGNPPVAGERPDEGVDTQLSALGYHS